MQELAPKLEKLRLKAVAKARDYMLTRIGELKKPKTHVQVRLFLITHVRVEVF
jgi:hypothetical protein